MLLLQPIDSGGCPEAGHNGGSMAPSGSCHRPQLSRLDGSQLLTTSTTSLRINRSPRSLHWNCTAPMPRLMVSLEFRLHPVAFAVRVIGHRRHVWFLSMEQEPDPMSLHRSWAPPPAFFCIVCHVFYGVVVNLSRVGLLPWGTCRTSAARLDGNPLRVDRFWVGPKSSPSGLSWAW